MVHNTKVEIVWTVVPVIILVAMAVPAASTLVEHRRHAQHRAHHQGDRLPVGLAVRLPRQRRALLLAPRRARPTPRASSLSGVDPNTIEHYLLNVDNPLVVPAGMKVRLLVTAADVIHAWWVPAFGMKKDAIPGFVNEMWFKVDPDKTGLYRGQCTELCGRDHAFMPIVVDVAHAEDFEAWLKSTAEQQKQAATRAAGHRAAAQPAAGDRLFEDLTIMAYDSHACTLTPPRRPRRPQAARLEALGLRHEPQGHRHDVPGVRGPDVLHRRRDGDGHPRRAVPARPAVRRSAVLQLDDDDARAVHDLRRGDAGVDGACELADPDAGRRARHGAAPPEQLQLLDPAVRVHDPVRRRCSCRAAAPPAAGRCIRRSCCRAASPSRW